MEAQTNSLRLSCHNRLQCTELPPNTRQIRAPHPPHGVPALLACALLMRECRTLLRSLSSFRRESRRRRLANRISRRSRRISAASRCCLLRGALHVPYSRKRRNIHREAPIQLMVGDKTRLWRFDRARDMCTRRDTQDAAGIPDPA